jgi:hypothetical protein
MLIGHSCLFHLRIGFEEELFSFLEEHDLLLSACRYYATG